MLFAGVFSLRTKEITQIIHFCLDKYFSLFYSVNIGMLKIVNFGLAIFGLNRNILKKKHNSIVFVLF
jgi:hypothetical protein